MLKYFRSQEQDVCDHLFRSDLGVVFEVDRDCVKSRFCTVQSRALDPGYIKGEQQCPRLRLRFTLRTTGEGHHIDGRWFARYKQQEDKLKVGIREIH